MFTLMMLCALTQVPDQSPGETVHDLITGVHTLYVPKHDVVKRCVSWSDDAEFREKLRDLADMLDSNASAPWETINLPRGPSARASVSIREFLVHRNYETAARMLMMVRKSPGESHTKATVALIAIMQSTDRWKYDPRGLWNGNTLPPELFTTVTLPKSQVSALESNQVFAELKKGFKEIETVQDLLEQLDRKYDGTKVPKLRPEVDAKDAA